MFNFNAFSNLSAMFFSELKTFKKQNNILINYFTWQKNLKFLSTTHRGVRKLLQDWCAKKMFPP